MLYENPLFSYGNLQPSPTVQWPAKLSDGCQSDIARIQGPAKLAYHIDSVTITFSFLSTGEAR